MPLTFYFEQHVPHAVAVGLRRRGIDVLTSEEDGAAAFDDERLLDRATEIGRVLFSQGRDLLVITHQRIQNGREFSGLAHAHPLNITVGQAIRDLEMLAKVIAPDEMRARIEFLPYD